MHFPSPFSQQFVSLCKLRIYIYFKTRKKIIIIINIDNKNICEFNVTFVCTRTAPVTLKLVVIIGDLSANFWRHKQSKEMTQAFKFSTYLEHIVLQGNSEKCTGAFKFGCHEIFYWYKICRKSGRISHLSIEFTKKNIHIML